MRTEMGTSRNIILAAALLLALLVGLIGIAAPFSLLGYTVLIAAWLAHSRKPASLGLTSGGWARSVLWGLASGAAVAIVALPIYLHFPQTSAHFLQFPQKNHFHLELK